MHEPLSVDLRNNRQNSSRVAILDGCAGSDGATAHRGLNCTGRYRLLRAHLDSGWTVVSRKHRRRGENFYARIRHQGVNKSADITTGADHGTQNRRTRSTGGGYRCSQASEDGGTRSKRTIKDSNISPLPQNLVLQTKFFIVCQRHLRHQHVQQNLTRNDIELFEYVLDVLKLLRRAIDYQRVGRRVRHNAQLLLRSGRRLSRSRRGHGRRPWGRKGRLRGQRDGSKSAKRRALGSRCRSAPAERWKRRTRSAWRSRGGRGSPVKILQRPGRLPPSGRGLSEDLIQYVRQLCRLTVLDRIDEDSSSRTLSNRVDPFEPALGIGPGRFAVADHQKLIDSWNGKELSSKTFSLGCR